MLDKTDKTGRKFSFSTVTQILQRTPVVAMGLVMSAVLIGVLYYAQAGLLIRSDSPSFDQTQAPDLSTSQYSEATQPKTSVLEEQKSVPPDAYASASPPETKKPITANCNHQAKNKAIHDYEVSIKAENELHKKRMSRISRLSKFLYMISGDSLNDKVSSEKDRHNNALNQISQNYQKTLAKINCQD